MTSTNDFLCTFINGFHTYECGFSGCDNMISDDYQNAPMDMHSHSAAPYPFKSCCSLCNTRKVIPLRILQTKVQKKLDANPEWHITSSS